MSCKYETEWCKNHVHCITCPHYEILELKGKNPMKTKEQKVERYFDIKEAEIKININIKNNWHVNTCISTCSGILVIYERELETWN